MSAQNVFTQRKTVHISLKILAALFALAAITGVVVATVFTPSPGAHSSGKGLTVAVTFYSLKPDIDLLMCNGDEVFSTTPPGVDPHEYQLTPSDVERLKSADLIVSTAHTPFESQIRDLVLRGELRAILVEIPSLPGLTIRVNPATRQPNYHWPIYDPENYKVYITAVEHALEKLKPECAQTYRKNLDSILDRIFQLEIQTPRLNTCAVLTSPAGQYALEWTGIKVKYLLVKEEGLPATPQDIAAAESAVGRGECKFVAVVGLTGTPVGQKATEIASRHGAPLITIPSPVEPASTIDKIQVVSQEIAKLTPKD